MDSADQRWEEGVQEQGEAASRSIEVAYAAMRDALLAYLRRQVGDREAAEDLLHQVFLKALAATRKGQRPSHLSGWLYSIARNAVIDHYRARRPMEPLPDEVEADEPGDGAAAQAVSACLRPLAEQLPPAYRDTVIAAELDGRSLREVAERQHVSLSAAKTRASRGRRMLRERLLACCELELSRAGAVLDFQPRAAAACGAPSCGTGTAKPRTKR